MGGAVDGPTEGRTIRVLTVCTGNICRSPVAERLFARHLGAAGHRAIVRSAGTWGGRQPVSAHTMRASAAIGLDLSDHRSRQLTAELIASDGADLIVAMTRQHLREIVALDQAAWPRTFTLKELARRAVAVPPGVGGFEAWREALGAGRRAAELMSPSPDDDIDDPYGGPFATHGQMVAEVDALIADVVRGLPPVGNGAGARPSP